VAEKAKVDASLGEELVLVRKKRRKFTRTSRDQRTEKSPRDKSSASKKLGRGNYVISAPAQTRLLSSALR
jgi:hypothetical protein